MFLSFIGSGSALNTALGNNSAFIRTGESILLLDCGSTTFSRMQSLSVLDDIKKIFVLITHRHPDHIASLGDLIFYAHFILKADVNVLTPDDQNVAELLEYMGVQRELYSLVKLNMEYKLRNSDLAIDITFIPVQHVADMDCYGYIIRHKDISIFYSGDASNIPDSVLQLFEKQEIDYIYQDVCSYDYPENPHMYISKLCEFVQDKDRHRLFCMHYDEGFDRLQVLQMGFKLIENI
jgi:ribonuclease BN (tRNA processing enzyme)